MMREVDKMPNEVEKIIRDSDFSTETDLKKRLRSRLFLSKVKELELEELDKVAGGSDPTLTLEGQELTAKRVNVLT